MACGSTGSLTVVRLAHQPWFDWLTNRHFSFVQLLHNIIFSAPAGPGLTNLARLVLGHFSTMSFYIHPITITTYPQTKTASLRPYVNGEWVRLVPTVGVQIDQIQIFAFPKIPLSVIWQERIPDIA